MSEQLSLDLLHGEFRPQFLLHGSDPGPRETAGNDPVKITQIRVHVECQTMIGNAFSHGNANRANFPPLDPHASPGGMPSRVQSEAEESLDRSALELAEIAMDVFSKL